jgi:CRP-like cAMP-binding protein
MQQPQPLQQRQHLYERPPLKQPYAAPAPPRAQPANLTERIAESPAIPATLNQLLAALPADDLARWSYRLEPVALQVGQVLYESGHVQQHVYFPTTAIVSLLYMTKGGQSVETAVVGNEGVVGIALFLGGETTPSSAVVRNAGTAYRLSARAAKAEFDQSGPLLHLMLRYSQTLITQMAQLAVCNRHHSVSQQLCRWLLASLDRVQGNELAMTQELIANLLGVRREGVTEAAGKLQREGLISYARGRIVVRDRPGLTLRSCECYGVVAKEHARLFPGCAERASSRRPHALETA